MDPVDAEEYTQALGQIGSGWWRQIALGQRLGVPAALGLTTDEWVTSRLGGYIRLSIPERREAAKELTTPVDEGGQGMSQREAAAVLGVHHKTVGKDLRPGECAPSVIEEESRPDVNDGELSPPADSVCEGCGTPTLPLWVNQDDEFTGSVLCGRCAAQIDEGMRRPVPEPEFESASLPPRVDGRRVWEVFLSVSALRDVDVSELVEALPDDRLEHVEPVVEALLEWLPQVTEEVRRRSARLPVGLRTERILRGKDELWLSPA